MILLQKCQKLFQNISTRNLPSRYNSFESSISLKKLYPTSSLKLTTPKPPENVEYYIPLDQLEITYSRSTGPGGQNVNKVNTKVDLRFKVDSATWLSDFAKGKIIEMFNDRLTKNGYLIFKSDLTRSQQLNLADCLEKLRRCIRKSVEEQPEPSVETQEKIRRRLERAARERLIQKHCRSNIKKDRQSL